MILKYLQEHQRLELVEGSRRSKRSPFEVLVVIVVAAVRLELRYPNFQSDFKPFFEGNRSIPSTFQSFFNFSLHSSKELTIKEQRTLAQLLRVVLVIVVLLEPRLLDCHMLVLGCISKTHFPCLQLKNQIVFNVFLHCN